MVQATKSRSVYRMDRQANERRRGHSSETQKSSPAPAANGFLNHRFLPVTENDYKELQSFRKVEREFFNSLSNLAALYDFPLPDVTAVAFPLNICHAFDYTKACMNKINPDLNLFIFQEQTTFIATAKTYDTGGFLYYISIAPLIRIPANKDYQQQNILLSIFTYLYQVVKIPFYTNPDSYVGSQYETLTCWLTEDDEQDADDERLPHLKLVASEGRKVLKKIRNSRHLSAFKRRLDKFTPASQMDEMLRETAKCALQLWQDYPESGLFPFIGEGFINPSEEQRVYPETYLGFMYDIDDCLNEDLISTVSEHLNNCGVIDEPMAFQFFNTKQQKEHHDLDFVTRVFDLFDNLIDCLKNY